MTKKTKMKMWKMTMENPMVLTTEIFTDFNFRCIIYQETTVDMCVA